MNNYRNLIASVFMMAGLYAQSIVGVVTDVDSQPLEGANIVVVGTDVGGVSDNSGAAPSMVSSSGVQAVRNVTDQFSEKYRLTMSNLIGSYMSGGKIPTESEFQQIDNLVRKVLDAKANSVDEILSDDPPF